MIRPAPAAALPPPPAVLRLSRLAPLTEADVAALRATPNAREAPA